MVEARLNKRDGIFSNAVNWAPCVRVNGELVTGQNPTSSGPGAGELLKLLRSV